MSLRDYYIHLSLRAPLAVRGNLIPFCHSCSSLCHSRGSGNPSLLSLQTYRVNFFFLFLYYILETVLSCLCFYSILYTRYSILFLYCFIILFLIILHIILKILLFLKNILKFIYYSSLQEIFL